MNKENRRVRYTRRVIREAYFELLRDKPISKITVAEICERADVHRGTFYQHYHDIYALQEVIEDQLMAEFDTHLEATQQGRADLAEAAVLAVFNDREACRSVLGEHGDVAFLQRVVERFRDVSYAKYRSLGMSEDSWPLVFTFATSGCIGVIREWVAADFDQDREQVIALIRTLTHSGIEGMASTPD